MNSPETPTLLDWVDDVADQFEAAWKQGTLPRLADFLDGESDERRSLLLAELVKIDLEYRWRSGLRPKLEDYLQEFPQLRGSDGTLAEHLLQFARQVQEEFREKTETVPAAAAESSGPFQGMPTTEASLPEGSLPEGGLPQIPGYELVAELGRGAMGMVFQARHVKLKRVVALKMIVAGIPVDTGVLERFRREAEAVAWLQHPHIVQIYEVGEHEGRPYFALEYVEGGSLEKKIAGGTPQVPGQAASWVETLARAVHYAHERGIVHRDLKPANVLLTPDGVPKIGDFGLAKQLDGELTQTRSGTVLGTPSYMAPEQAKGKTDAIGPRADVYALGAILYELLTGRPPFKAASVWDTVVQVLQDDPVPPRRLQPKLPRDLETICLKCLRKEPDQRYASALDLADDLGRVLKQEPIRARPVSNTERLWRWCRRNPMVASLTALVAATLVAGTAVAWYLAIQAQERAAEAQANLYVTRMNLAQAAWENGNVRLVHELLDIYRKPSSGAENLRGWEWFFQEKLCHSDLRTLRRPQGISSPAAFSPDGRYLVVRNTEDHSLAVCDMATDQVVRTLRGHTKAHGKAVFSPDGQYVASGGQDNTVGVWEVATGKELRSFAGHKNLHSLAFSPQGRHLASGDQDGTIRVWDVVKGQMLLELAGHKGPIVDVVFMPSGQGLASAGSADGMVNVWDATTGTRRRAFAVGAGTLAFSEDGQRLAAAHPDGIMTVWDVVQSKQIHKHRCHTGRPEAVVFSPDGLVLASSGGKNPPRLWDVASGRELRLFRGHSDYMDSVSCLLFSPDGRCLLTVGGADQTVKLWSVTLGQPARTLEGHTKLINSVAFCPKTHRFASAGDDGTVKLWDARIGQELRTINVQDGTVETVAFSPEGRWLATGSADALVKVWDAADGRLLHTWKGHENKVSGVSFSPDGKLLASSSQDYTAIVWEVPTGRVLHTLHGHTGKVQRVAFSPDGRRLATASDDHTVKVWDTNSGREILTLRGHSHWVYTVAFSPDGRLLASADHDGILKMWSAADGGLLRTLKGHSVSVVGVAFSPDGRRLASASGDYTVKLWDVFTGQELHTLKGHTERVDAVAFSADGRWLASAGGDTTVKLWDARPVTDELRLEQEGLALAEFLFTRPLPKQDVLHAIRTDQTIREPVREQALVLAERFQQERDPKKYADAARLLVRQPWLKVRWYEQALHQAEAACRLAPEDTFCVSTLGMAQYRLGNHQTALDTLARAMELNAQQHKEPSPAILAFLAMAHHRLEHTEKAQAALIRLRDPANQPTWVNEAEAGTLFREAEALLAAK